MHIPLDGLWRQIKHLPVAQGAPQLQILGVRPDKRPGRTAGAATEQVALGDVSGVPDLFRDQAAGTRKAFEGAEQRGGLLVVTGSQLIVSALSREQRPGPANAGAVERA